jgi:hypothetical protein
MILQDETTQAAKCLETFTNNRSKASLSGIPDNKEACGDVGGIGGSLMGRPASGRDRP